MKAEPLLYGDRKVYTVAAFNRGIASWIARLPTLWVEGEVTELRRQPGWQSVFFTLTDREDGSSLPVTMPRGSFDALRLELSEGALVHVYGRPELWVQRGSFQLRALTIEPVGLGEVLLRLERLRRALAEEGLFAPERKRPLPFMPRLIGLVTGSDAAARHDVVATIRHRFPPARLVVAEALVQGPRAPDEIARALRRICEAGADVIILARGGGSFDDLLPFSDERLVRAVSACSVPVVSAVGHEQDTPLCDLAADARASTPTAAARLVVPDWAELMTALETLHARTESAARRLVSRAGHDLARDRLRLARAPALLLERKRTDLAGTRERLAQARDLLVERAYGSLDVLAGRLQALSPIGTLRRGYSIVRREGEILRSTAGLAAGQIVDVELSVGGFGARVEEVRPGREAPGGPGDAGRQ
jgi:exodeoxyribonuclease VII large subunit